MPTAAQAVRIARYHPHITPRKPKPPAMFNNFAMCAASAAVVADGIENSAAAMKANMKTRPKNVREKNALTRKVPIRKTKLVRHLQQSVVEREDTADITRTRRSCLHRNVVKTLRRGVSRAMGASKFCYEWRGDLMCWILRICEAAKVTTIHQEDGHGKR